MNVFFYYLLFGFALVFSLVPFFIMYLFSDLLYLVIFYVARYRRSTVYNNLKKAFPEKDEAEISLIAKRFYSHFADFLIEAVRCVTISKSTLLRRVKVRNPEVLKELADKKQNFAIVSAHYNNWEWLNILPHYMQHELLIIYRPLKNKITDRLTKNMRQRFGAKLFPMESIFRECLKYKSNEKMFSVWFLADQRPPRNSKFWTRFLNQEAAFFEGAEKISKKLGMALVFLDIQKTSRGHYEVVFTKLIEDASKTSDNEVTLTTVKAIEQEIRNRPEFWLWSHKRFKHKRPENTNLVTL